MQLDPDAVGVVFFDGMCGLCDQTVSFLVAKDRRRVLRFAPLQGNTAKLLTKNQRENLETLVYRRADGMSFERSAAVLRALVAIGGPWKLVGALIWVVPPPLRDFAYKLVAANRYKWFGRRATCRIPSAAERRVFLD